MASMASVTTRGFSVGTFTGSASLVVTLGYGLGVVSPVTLVGPWVNVIYCQSANARTEGRSSNSRIEARSQNVRIAAHSANRRIACQSSNRRMETCQQ
jgi:hypothetical protein